ncbi:hypothetical protein DL98DRAFT_615911 [Cadophora sp. DSE1049]|nr:hypothetical protein DL98DRAFT_615911 [Cadophora sp. DSE1049]
MCQFFYQMFEQCSHGVINIAEYCRMQKWKAGIERRLRPCLESTYRISRYEDRGAHWQVISGSCFACILERRPTAQLVASTSQGGPTGKCIPMRPRKPEQDYRKDSLSPIPPERPFLSFPGLTTTMPELLGFRDKLCDKTAALFHKVVFPPRIMSYVDQTPFSWAIKALGPAHSLDLYFIDNGGLLVEDRKSIATQKLWKDDKAMWETDFKPRGIPYGIFKEQCIKGEASFPANSATATICARFCQLHAESADAQMERALEHLRKVEGLGLFSELNDALGEDPDLGEAVVGQDTNDSVSQPSLATQMQAAHEAQFGSPTGTLDNINKAGPPPRPWVSTSSISLPNSFEQGPPYGQNLGLKAQTNASNIAYATGQMSNPSTFSSFQQGLPQGQNFGLMGQINASNAGYITQQMPEFSQPTFSDFQQGLSLMGQASASNTTYATGQMNNFYPSAFSSFPQGRFIPPPTYPSIQGQMDGINHSGYDLANQTLLARLGGGMFTDTTIPTTQAASESALEPAGQIGAFTQGGLDPREQQISDMLNANLASETPVPTTQVAPGSALDPARQYNAIGQGGFDPREQQLVHMFNANMSSDAPVPITQVAPGWAPGPAGQFNTSSQGGVNPGEQPLFSMPNGRILKQAPVPTIQVAPALDPVEQFNDFGQSGFNPGDQRVFDALNGSIHSQAPVPTTQGTPGSALELAGQLDGTGQGVFDSENQDIPTIQDGQISAQTSMPTLQGDLGQAFNPLETSDTFGQGGFESGNKDLNAILDGHISEQAPMLSSQTPFGLAADSAGQPDAFGDLNVGKQTFPSAVGGDTLGQSATPLLGGQSSSQTDMTGQPDVFGRAEVSVRNDMNIDQPFSGILDEGPLGFGRNLLEQQQTLTGEMEGVLHSENQQTFNAVENHLGPGQVSQSFPNPSEDLNAPTGAMEGVVHGEDQHTFAEAVATPSGPGQEPNLSASLFGDEDGFLEEYINFDQDAAEEPND